MSKPAILLIGGVTHVQKEWEECSSFAVLKEYTGKTREDFLADCASGEWNDVVALYRSNESTSVRIPHAYSKTHN
jgi:glyoxylate reductase